ncbi:MAG: hypothetical protein IJX93_11940 [Clostridia bacterium]|nr:hypothetical protein [Clostridia bacterium]MBQ8370906.1 hypothetical protein [Clostridia bacterium]
MKKVFALLAALLLLFCTVPVSADDLPKSAAGRLDYIRQEHPEQFCYFWTEGEVLHVSLTTDDPEILAEYDAILEGYVPQVVFELVPYSFDQLEALQDAVDALYADGNPYAVKSTSILARKCAVQVIGILEGNDELKEKLYEICAELGMSEDAINYVEDPTFQVQYLDDASPVQTRPMNQILLPFVPVAVLLLVLGGILLIKRHKSE